MSGGGFGRVQDVILAIITSIAHALGHDHDGRPADRGGDGGQPARIWPTNV